ncbi:MAG: GcrA family cell cycle regulator [Alphaproteobacteria bacterium]
MAFEWTPDHIKTLMALWAEGLPTLEIGRRLGITKNAVVGKVHRLGLPKRQSPISSTPKARVARVPVAQIKSAPPRPSGKIITMEMLTTGMCNWPDGEPGQDDFRFCGEQVIEGKPYCQHHCERAYVRGSRDRTRQPAQNKAFRVA